ncbi:MAG TPA: SLBB domain-containing protein [Rhizomicrobium sp.]|jgi:protein involved in polysaccharide export with SLBB domain|nr:SLBB domain-containing protein [Rhizomicrobium sp.]
MQTLRQFMLVVRRHLRRILVVATVAIAGGTMASSLVLAQSASGSGLGQVIQNVLNQPGGLQQILQGGGLPTTGQPSNPTITVSPSVSPQTTMIPVANQPMAVQGQSNSAMPPATPSGPPQTHLEKIMSDRAGVPLSLFGYDQVGSGESVPVPTIGAIPDNYILGPGDQIDVSTRGQGSTSNDYRVTVDRDGRVILPGVPPVAAAGREFGDFRRDMVEAVRRAFMGTQAYVTIAQLRQINVMVVGEINIPGMRAMTALSSPLDAILVSGGIQRTGSLRNIVIFRGAQRIRYDLYDILTQQGVARQILLQDGDRIVVAPLGQTLAVVGWVRKPGIYELPPGAAGMTTRGLISLAGGLEVRGGYHLTLLHVERDGHQIVENLTGMSGRVGDSDILFVQPAAELPADQVTYAGGQNSAGRYSSTGHSGRLSALLRDPGALGLNPYTLFGVVSRRDPHTYLRVLVPFSPVAVLAGRDDMQLQSDDIVRVFSTDETKLIDKAAQDFETQVQQTTDQSHSLGAPMPGGGSSQQSQQQQQTALPQIPNLMASTATSTAQIGNQGTTGTAVLPTSVQQSAPIAGFDVTKETITPSNPVLAGQSITNFGDLATQLSVDPVVLINFIVDHEANIDGAVRGPGTYIVGPGTTLPDLVAAAGGTQNWTDESNIQLITTVVDRGAGTSATKRETLALKSEALINYIVQPQDDFRFNRVYTTANAGQIDLEGEIRSPGSYQITHGEHLSELLVQAGGLTDTAYPYGTVFLRKSIAQQEAVGYQRVADQLQTQLLVGLGQVSSTSGGTSFSPDAIAGMEALITQLRNQSPIGRISFVADPSILAAHPERDPLLEPGDVIFIPQRPSTVTVLGEVMQPGSFPFNSDKSPEDYIDQAGGYGRYADEGNTFIVYPDGSARAMDTSWIHFSSAKLPPGTVIFVPKNILPINWVLLSTTLADILKDFAVSAASLVVLQERT